MPGEAAVFDEILAGIPLYSNLYHCGEACRQIWHCTGKEMRSFRRIVYLASTAALHDPLPCHRAVFKKELS